MNIEQMEKMNTIYLILAYMCLSLFAVLCYFEAHGLLLLITLMLSMIFCGSVAVQLSKIRRCRILGNIFGGDVNR